MDLFVFLALLQDGITTGAIYLLLAIGLLIVFSVTRVIFVPQGDLLAFGALTAATLQSGQVPGTLWLFDGVAAVALVASLFGGWRAALRGVLTWGVYPFVVTVAAKLLAPHQVPAVSILLALAIVTPMGPLIWRFAFRPIADASVLALLILAMALHFVLIGLGLVFFGPEEASAPRIDRRELRSRHHQCFRPIACCAAVLWRAGSGTALVLLCHHPRQGVACRRFRPIGRAPGRHRCVRERCAGLRARDRSSPRWPAC